MAQSSQLLVEKVVGENTNNGGMKEILNHLMPLLVFFTNNLVES